jgi:predicted short-subunit dehydrogenase-like oxidoreductase (DUF2520 family)
MTFALAGGGRVSATFVARLPRLTSELGPVAAQSYRLASRIVNSIGAGAAVRGYADLNECRLILICAPVRAVDAMVSALGEAIACRGKVILLCESGCDSRKLAGLRAQGAEVGSMQPIPGFEGRRFLVEGDKTAVREAKSLARALDGRVEEAGAGKMDLYLAALSFGTSLFTPLLEAAVRCLQQAGMPQTSAVRIAEALFRESLRGYVYAGKRSWSGPLAMGDRAAVERELEALTASMPLLARQYREASAWALELLGGPAGRAKVSI